MECDINNNAHYTDNSHSTPPLDYSDGGVVRVFIDSEDDYHDFQSKSVAWTEKTLTLLLLITYQLPAISSDSLWTVYAEQGYGIPLLLGTINQDQTNFIIHVNMQHAPKTRFVWCEPLKTDTYKRLSSGEDVQRTRLHEQHIRTNLKQAALSYTYFVPCTYTYADQEYEQELKQIAPKIAEREQNDIEHELKSNIAIVWFSACVLVLFAGFLLGNEYFTLQSWQNAFLSLLIFFGALALLGSLLTMFSTDLSRKRQAQRIVNRILTHRLHAKDGFEQHTARFWSNSHASYYEDELYNVKVADQQITPPWESEHFVYLVSEWDRIIPVSKAAL